MGIKQVIQEKLILQPKVNSVINRNAKNFVSLSKAKTVAIVADVGMTKELSDLSRFNTLLREQKISAHFLLFVNQNRGEINQYDFEKNLPGAVVMLICQDELTKLYVPKKKVLLPFLEPEYDIAFRIAVGPNFSIDVALTQLKARMYAGQNHPDISYLDFSIAVDENEGLGHLIDNLIVYIQKIDNHGTDGSKQKRDYTLF